MEGGGRNGAADLLKGAAVLLMIQVHLMELFARPEIAAGPIGRASLFLGGPPAAPLFMCVMGYFVGRSGRSAGRLTLRGFRLILGGLLLNLGLNAHLLVRIHLGRVDLDPWEYVFGADILILAGLATIVLSIVRRAFRNRVPLYAALAVAAAGATPLLPPTSAMRPEALKFALSFFWGDCRWSYFPLLPWLAYPLAGLALERLVRNAGSLVASRGLQGAVAVGGGCAAALWIGYAVDVSADLPRYYHHDLAFFGWTVLFLAACAVVFRGVERRMGNAPALRYLKWLGRNVAAAYVFQWLLIGNLATALYRTQSAGALGLWFAAIVAATSLATVAWRWTVGRRPVRAASKTLALFHDRGEWMTGDGS